MNKIEISLDTPGLLPQYRHIHERHRHYEYNHSCVSSHPPRDIGTSPLFQTISAMTPHLLFSLLLLLLLFSCPSSSAETFPIPPTARNLKGEGQYCYSEVGGVSAGLNSYKTCEAGYYCPGYNDCTICDCWGTNLVVNEESSPRLECPSGKYSAAGQSSCALCDAGKASAARMATSSATCQDCTEGKYSMAGSSVCTECDSGRYNSQTASPSVSYCNLCVAGTYNPDTGSTTEEDCKDCGKGKYSLAGSASCMNCGTGKYNVNTKSPSESSCTECVGGTANPNTGSTGEEVRREEE